MLTGLEYDMSFFNTVLEFARPLERTRGICAKLATEIPKALSI